MEQLTARPAVVADFLEALDATGRAPAVSERRPLQSFALQVEQSAAITVRDGGGALCMIVGLYPSHGREAYAWFAPGPAMRANLRRCMVEWRGMLDRAAGALAPVVVHADVDPQSVAGRRLALMLGFTEVGAVAGRTMWERSYGHP